MSSNLFSGFRALGFCSNEIPLSLSVKGTDSYVCTSIGNAFHVYEVTVVLKLLLLISFLTYIV